ncbi:hypothetical protein [Nostoc sp. CENA543]|uniref:hypothetical protein n=1 Tax=Nostoc sp. CENA543 TaxID=1869241 RepID=UPI001CEF58A9|nr:hypothetical protein [Nostoc sp. CENA543]
MAIYQVWKIALIEYSYWIYRSRTFQVVSDLRTLEKLANRYILRDHKEQLLSDSHLATY